MKWLFRTYLYTFFSIWLTEHFIPGFVVSDGLLVLGIVTAGMVILNTFVKPLIKLVLLPLNIATLGIVSFFINAGLLWILSYFLPEISVSEWVFEQYVLLDIVIPQIEFGILASYIVTSFCISGIIMFLQWIRK